MNSGLHPVTTHKKMGSSGKAANYTSTHQPRFSQESRTSPESVSAESPWVGKENTGTWADATMMTKKRRNKSVNK